MGINVVNHYNKDSNCIPDLYWSLFNINHTGQESCGIFAYDGEFKKPLTHDGLVRELKVPEDYKGYCGIGNVNNFLEKQPMTFYSPKLGNFALVFDGYIINRDDLRRKLGGTFSTKYDVETIGRVISEGNNFTDGIEILANSIVGNYCLGIISEDGGVIGARCPLGIKPLMFGEGKKGNCIVTESRPFRKIGMELVRDLDNGEIVKCGDYGISTIKNVEGKKGRKRKTCSFWYGYFGWVDSIVEGIPINLPRERIGALHARKDIEDGLEVDVVIGMADSGKAYAEGYRNEYFGNSEAKVKEIESKMIKLEFYIKNDDHIEAIQLLNDIKSIIPRIKYVQYTEGEIKYPYAIRSYNRPKIIREVEAFQKYSTVDSRVKGKNVVITDDSVRTGNVFNEGPIRFLKAAGAKSIHVRIGSPKNIAFCRVDDIPMGGDSILIANHLKTDKEIAEYFGVDSIRFPENNEYIYAIITGTNFTEDDFCWGCYNGDFSFLLN